MCLDERSQKGCYLLENTITGGSRLYFLPSYLSDTFFEGHGVDRVQRGSQHLGLFMQLLMGIRFKLDQSGHSAMSSSQIVGINLPRDSLQ